MWLLDQLAEQHIQQALARGELDNLPGAGQPLQFDDDPLVPADQRMAYKILKNAGYVPAEVLQRKEAAQLHQEMHQTHDESSRRRIAARLNCLLMHLDASRRDRTSLLLRSEYYTRTFDRMMARHEQAGD